MTNEDAAASDRAKRDQPTLPLGDASPDDSTNSPLPADRGDVTLPPLEDDATQALRRRPDSVDGERIKYFGDYALIEEIARGGMGIVYKARQVNLNRIVALKMILAGRFAGEEDVKRFRTEAEAAARLDHPGIVPIFEIGEHEGRHYFSMAFVDGESLLKRISGGPLAPRDAADIVEKICDAIAYAHQRGVIHRDLKPANVLIDEAGQPKVTDFGLAKQIESTDGLTGTGQVLGTPGYMPPEQARGTIEEIGPQSDVYSLGAMLYCLVVGRPPFQAANPLDTLLQVLEQQPVSPRALNPKIDVDLETICLKCLEKPVERRYRTAVELKDELRRFLDGEPIVARPVGRPERLWRWCKRNRSIAAMTAVAALAMVAGAATSVLFGLQASRQAAQNLIVADEAQRQLRIATTRRLISDSMVAREQWPQRSALLAVEAFDRARDADESTLMAARQNLCDAVASIGGTPIPGAQVVQFSPDDRYAAIGMSGGDLQLWDLSRDRPDLSPRVLNPDESSGDVGYLAFSPNSRWLAVGYVGGRASVWDLLDDRAEPAFAVEGHRTAVSVHFDRASRWLMTRSANVPYDPGSQAARYPHVQLCDLRDSRSPPRKLDFRNEKFLAFSDDGRWLLTQNPMEPHSVERWDLSGDEPVSRTIRRGESDDEVTAAVVSADGSRFATFGDREVRLYEADESSVVVEKVLYEADKRLRSPLMTGDGRWLIACQADDDGTFLHLWDLSSDPADTSSQRLAVSDDWWVGEPALLADDKMLVAGELSLSVLLWDLTVDDVSTSRRRISSRHSSAIMDVAVSSDDRWLFTSGDKTIRRHDLRSEDSEGETFVYRGHEAACLEANITGDAQWMATADESGEVRWWNTGLTATNGFCTLLRGHERPVLSTPVLLTDPPMLATAAGRGRAILWRGDAADPSKSSSSIGTKTQGIYGAIAASDDRRLLATANESHQVDLWRIAPDASVRHVGRLSGHADEISAVAFSPGGRLLVTGSEDGTARVWSVSESGDAFSSRVLTGNSPVTLIRFSPDGRWMLTAGRDQVVGSLWKIDGGKIVGRPRPIVHDRKYSDGGLRDAAFRPDGRWLATVSSDHTTRLWDLESPVVADDRAAADDDEAIQRQMGRDRESFVPTILRGHDSPVTSVAFSPDGSLMATGSWDHDVRVWEFDGDRPPSSSLVLRGHDDWTTDVAFSADGNWLATASVDNTVRLWNMSLENPASASILLGGHRASVRSVAFAEDDRLYSVSDDTDVRRWELNWRTLRQAAIGRSGRRLTYAERLGHGLDESMK